MFANRQEHFVCQVCALLCAVLLVLNVHADRAVLSEYLIQLVNRFHTVMARVAISDDRVQKTYYRVLNAQPQRDERALLRMLAVVNLVSLHQLLQLLKHRVVRVLGQFKVVLV